MSDPMVSTEWLKDRLSASNVRVVDASLPLLGQPGQGREFYEAGHIPGAVFFDINAIADLTTDLPHMLPTSEAFADAAGVLGLDPAATVVVYDAHGLWSAPRVWWTLRVMGYPQVFVLDGGLPAWRAAGGAIETGDTQVAAVRVTPKPVPNLVAGLKDVQSVIVSGAAQLVDARSGPRFRAEAPEPRAGLRSGHMPGALNVPFSLVVAEDGTLKPRETLAQVFAGVDLSRPIITTCGSGLTAAVLALALARLGRDDVAVYDGSWTEWGGRADTAVVTGA
jgi:thiosulfate/3-mercaptopyruvate sulfurtransferase